jgi:hypothetical protein
MAAQYQREEEGEVVVLFHLVRRGESVKLREEKQYRIVPAGQIRGTH